MSIDIRLTHLVSFDMSNSISLDIPTSGYTQKEVATFNTVNSISNIMCCNFLYVMYFVELFTRVWNR